MNRYKLRNRTHFPQPLVRPIYNCQESLTYLDTKRWEIVFIGRKETETLFEFKKKSQTVGLYNGFVRRI